MMPYLQEESVYRLKWLTYVMKTEIHIIYMVTILKRVKFLEIEGRINII